MVFSHAHLNFLQKSRWAHMSISPWSGAREEGQKIDMVEIL